MAGLWMLLFLLHLSGFNLGLLSITMQHFAFTVSLPARFGLASRRLPQVSLWPPDFCAPRSYISALTIFCGTGGCCQLSSKYLMLLVFPFSHSEINSSQAVPVGEFSVPITH